MQSFHTCIRCCVRATNTSVDSVDKHSIKCIACFDLHINSVDKQDTILNTLNSKFLSNFGKNPIISCLKIMVNSNTVNSK